MNKNLPFASRSLLSSSMRARLARSVLSALVPVSVQLGFSITPWQAQAANTREPDLFITYKPSNPTGTKQLHVFYPPGGHTNAPAIVFFGGGGWANQNPAQFYAHSTYFSAEGIVCIPTEYRTRNTGGVSPFGCVEDGNSAIRYVRQHATELGVNPNRIVAAGASAGGHVALCTSEFPYLIDASEDPSISSVPNLLILFNPVLDTSTNGYGSDAFDPGENPLDLSPQQHVCPGVAPTVAFAGTADGTVPFQNELDYQQTTRQAGNFYTLMSFPGRHHGFFNDNSFSSSQNDGDYNLTVGYMEDFLLKWGYLGALPLVTNFGTSGIYGEAPVAPNTVDASVGDKNIQAFATDIQNAFRDGNGGVVNFETGFNAVPSDGATSNNPLDHNFDFQLGSNKAIRVTSSLDFYLYSNGNNNQVTTLSGSNSILSGTPSTAPTANFTWLFRGVRNGAPRESMTELAFTVLSRTTYPATGAVIEATVHFSGGNAATLGAVVGNGRGTSDTFFHFTAPTNEWIQSVDFTNQMAQTDTTTVRSARLVIDDVAFITSLLPELRLQAVPLSGSQANIRFWGSKGQFFRLERSVNLTAWTLLQPCLAGTGDTVTAVDTNALDFLRTNGCAFYRIAEE